MKINQEELLLQEIEAARKRLLDLTSRNRLLNYRVSKVKTIEFSNYSMKDLFDSLVRDEKKMSFQSVLKSHNIQSEEDDDEPLFDLLSSDYEEVLKNDNSHIPVNLRKEDLQTKLHKISKLSDSFFEEQGYSILFAAVGLINWKEAKTSITNQKAPLLLIPVELKRARIGSPYKLNWTGDDIISNVCMIEKAKELNVNIPEFALNEEDIGISNYINKVKKAIEKQNWAVEEYSCIDFFSFAKFVLWKDLEIKSWPEGLSPLDNALMQKLLLPLEITQNDIYELDDYDKELEVLNVYSILDSDPSQISVIEAVKKGVDLVVEGPPGTGKSQTIANIIAEQLSIGKSVLFVSEKMAALEVVKTRLDEAGLEDYCLELHSRKTNKRQFISVLSRILSPSFNHFNIDLSAYNNLLDQRDHLNNYSNLLKSKIGGRNLTVFQLIGIKERESCYFDKENRNYVCLDIPNAELINEKNWNIIETEIDAIEPYASAIKIFSTNPWVGTKPDFFLESEIDGFCNKLTSVHKRYNDYKKAFMDLKEKYGINLPNKIKDIPGIANTISLLLEITNVGSDVINNKMWDSPEKSAFYIIKSLESFQKNHAIFDENKSDSNDVKENWKITWEFLNHTRSLYSNVEHLSHLTCVKSEISIEKLNVYLSACKVIADAKSLKRENILNSKWSEYEDVEKIVSLLDETQNQYKKVATIFSQNFLKEDNSTSIQDYKKYNGKKLRFFSFKYAKTKKHLKTNIISSNIQSISEIMPSLDEALDYFSLKKILNETSIKSSELFGSYWKGIDSDSRLLQEIVQWHKEFMPLYNIEMYSDDVFKIIVNGCRKSEVYSLIGSSKNLIDSISPQKEDIISRIISNKGPSSSIRDLINATVANLKYIRLKKIDTTAFRIFGYHWKSSSSDSLELRHFTDWVLRFKKAVTDNILTPKAIELLDVSDFNKTELNDYLDLFSDSNNLLEQTKDIYIRLGTSEDKTNAILDFVFMDTLSKLDLWKGNISSLAAWNDYIRAKNNCKHKVSKLLISELEKGTIEYGSDIIHFLYASYADILLKASFRNSPELMNFNGSVHSKRIEVFTRLDRKITELNRLRLREKLSIARPKLVTNASSNSEVGFLLGEINKKRAHKSIRQVILRAGNLIQKIKPCFLMSPLSIAQFLDPKGIKFDTIIFDEASQVRPEDAIGSLMRGSQLVVMGDSKQLPPTTFFDHMVDEDLDVADNDIDYTSVVDIESILQQCISKLPRKHLNWHYRSRHESLILVSNSFFYDNRLQVFPSPFSKDKNIGLHYVHLSNSVYDRGKTSVNRIEAKYIVELACLHYAENPGLSLGIGTFSAKQQDAILNELELILRSKPEIQHHFSKDNHEHFFVKNLETIQGDERDVVIISVGYGFDAARNLSMNFGPLNQDGGHRRLNVLITRARQKCIVVSNFRAADLKITASSPLGITALQAYLQYADTGDLVNLLYDQDSDSPFEDSVFEFLSEKGYNVVKQVGCARFKIDMAITHPENSSHYLLGIECDGAMYHSSPTARERDRLRQEVLENLGWTIFRIWSTDWYRNRQKCKDQLISAIDLAINQPQKRLHQTRITAPKKPVIDNHNHYNEEIVNSRNDEGILNAYSMQLDEYKDCDEIELYPGYELHEMPLSVLVKAVSAIVEIESPIHREDVITRIRSLAGYEKTGSRIHNSIDQAIDYAINIKQIRELENFLWDKKKRCVKPRHRSSMINIHRICTEEIEAVIKLVLENQLSTEIHDLCVQVSRLLGIQRLTSESEVRITDVIAIMLRKKILKKSNTNYVQLSNKNII